jgi:hypothetical protein
MNTTANNTNSETNNAESYLYVIGKRNAARAAALDCSRWIQRHRPAIAYLLMSMRTPEGWAVEIPAEVMADPAAEAAMMDLCSQHA